MTKLFFDIETLPADAANESIVRKLYEKKLTQRVYERLGSYEDFLRRTSMDGGLGRIFCIGYAEDDKPAEVLEGGDEKDIVRRFWLLAETSDLVIGHNIFDFDLPFIYQRSVVHQLKPTKDLFPRRYSSDVVFDTYHEWTKWHREHKPGSLDYLAHILDLPSSKQGIDGSQVYDFYLAGRGEEIADYCKRDVELTRQIYERLTFSK